MRCFRNSPRCGFYAQQPQFWCEWSSQSHTLSCPSLHKFCPHICLNGLPAATSHPWSQKSPSTNHQVSGQPRRLRVRSQAWKLSRNLQLSEFLQCRQFAAKSKMIDEFLKLTLISTARLFVFILTCNFMCSTRVLRIESHYCFKGVNLWRGTGILLYSSFFTPKSATPTLPNSIWLASLFCLV